MSHHGLRRFIRGGDTTPVFPTWFAHQMDAAPYLRVVDYTTLNDVTTVVQAFGATSKTSVPTPSNLSTSLMAPISSAKLRVASPTEPNERDSNKNTFEVFKHSYSCSTGSIFNAGPAGDTTGS